MWVAALVSAGTSMYTAKQEKDNQPEMSQTEYQSREDMAKAQGGMAKLFQERVKNPYQSMMPLAEQDYFNRRRDAIYGQDRERSQQSLMGAMNRTGALASGASNYNLQRFGQETLNDKRQFYFQDQQNRLQQRETALQNTFNMGSTLMGTPVQGTAQTDLANAQTRQRLAWKTRWSNMAGSMANQYMGSQMGQSAAGDGTGGTP